MKYLIIILGLFTSKFCLSQTIERNNSVSDNSLFSNNSMFSENYDDYDTNDNEDVLASIPPVNPPTPINDYLPLLAVAAVGLGFYYRKELNQTIKSN